MAELSGSPPTSPSSPQSDSQPPNSIHYHLNPLCLQPPNNADTENIDEDKSDCDENKSETLMENENEDENENKEKASSKGIRFPIRVDVEDCPFFLRTGMCKFGMNCKFNHPPVRKFQGGKVKGREESKDGFAMKVKDKEGSLDKEGSVDCKYFDRPGGCKFGKACKFNHSRKNTPTLELNFMGLPIRLGEKECPYYMRNGSCKYGVNCRFNHPDPMSMGGSDTLSPFSNGGSVLSSNSSQSTLSPWPAPALNGSPPYLPLMFPPAQGVTSRPEWTAYQAPVLPAERNMNVPPAYAVNGLSTNGNAYTHQQEQILVNEFPERPGQPECNYFLKTGNCKYRYACKFHHPKSGSAKLPCALSDSGLPLRPGESVCSYYNRYGICKYGPACKYDHSVNHAHSSSALPVTTVDDENPVLVNSVVNSAAVAAAELEAKN